MGIPGRCGTGSIGTVTSENERHFLQAVEYIRLNPVKAGLVEAAENWKWSSVYLEG